MEAPGKFLYRLRETLCRFTEIDPESEEGKVILKDRFLTQSAPDICHKLVKQAYGTNQSLDNLLQLVQTAVKRASTSSFVFLCLCFPHIPCHNRLSEAVATDYLKTDLVYTPDLIAYSGCLEPTE